MGRKILVTTNKAEYAQGETVTISVRNDLPRPLWYAQQVDCGLSFWLLERCETDEIVYYKTPCVWVAPDHRFARLDPGEALQEAWAGTYQLLEDSGLGEKLAEPGCYRVRFPFSLLQPDPGWMDGRIELFSDPFTIK